jgi:PiT family inorganic phosphate transporter
VSVELAVAVALALAYALTNGLHDASNAIAALVATRMARPLAAVTLASVFNLLGAFLLGAAVASTVGGVVTLAPQATIRVVGSGLAGAVVWNLVTWQRGLPSSSGHALVGGLVGAGLVESGLEAIRWGGVEGWRPVGVFGILIALAGTPLVGALAAVVLVRAGRRALRRATRAVEGPIRAGQWLASAFLAFGQGSNNAPKAAGAIALVLLADGRADSLRPPLWATAACAVALTAGTVTGGWAIVRTIGRRIYELRPLDGLASQASSSTVMILSSLAGAPVSATHVVASSVVGVGGGRRRWRRVDWTVVVEMGVAWLTTIPATAAIAAVTLLAWRWLA